MIYRNFSNLSVCIFLLVEIFTLIIFRLSSILLIVTDEGGITRIIENAFFRRKLRHISVWRRSISQTSFELILYSLNRREGSRKSEKIKSDLIYSFSYYPDPPNLDSQALSVEGEGVGATKCVISRLSLIGYRIWCRCHGMRDVKAQPHGLKGMVRVPRNAWSVGSVSQCTGYRVWCGCYETHDQ